MTSVKTKAIGFAAGVPAPWEPTDMVRNEVTVTGKHSHYNVHYVLGPTASSVS